MMVICRLVGVKFKQKQSYTRSCKTGVTKVAYLIVAYTIYLELLTVSIAARLDTFFAEQLAVQGKLQLLILHNQKFYAINKFIWR